MRSVLAPILTVLVVGCAKAPPSVDLDAEKAELMQASRNWASTVSSGNLDSMVSYWADDAVVMPPGEAALVGKEAIRGYVAGMLAVPRFSITWEPEQAEVSVSGDMGYLVERNTATFTDSTGTRQTHLSKAITIWRKNPEGQWKCVVDGWSDVPTHPVLPGR
jgi:uncharacterized protein (TIGR02246 family)